MVAGLFPDPPDFYRQDKTMSDDKKVISLSGATGNAGFQSPEQALRDAISEIGQSGAFKDGKKLLILALDDEGQYDISFIQAGMRMSECITLCEVAKAIFLREMEYI